MYTYSFEKLEVWVEAKKLSKEYTVLREHIESITNKLNALRNYQINE